MTKSTKAAHTDNLAKLIEQYGCGPIKFTGTDEALYERHLLFDSVTDMRVADARDRFEAIARSVRDVLSQRWIRTQEAYQRSNAKRIYYLSIEFLIGRSLANNLQNLQLDQVARQLIKEKDLDWVRVLEQEPDAGLGNGGLGRLAACFLDPTVRGIAIAAVYDSSRPSCSRGAAFASYAISARPLRTAFDGVSARLFHLTCITDPTAG